MKAKKNPKYNLEKKRIMFLQFGIILSLAIVLLAFEYKVPMEEPEEIENKEWADIEEVIVNTFHEPKKKLEPPKPIPPNLEDLLEEDEEPEIEYIPEEIDVSPETVIKYEPVQEEVEEEEKEFYHVEQMPIFNPKKNSCYDEGRRDLFTTLQKSVNYPVQAQESCIQGKVFVKFTVNKTGEITKVQVVRSVDPILDKEVIRVVQNLPNFKPGKQGNKTVAVSFTCFVNFTLQ